MSTNRWNRKKYRFSWSYKAHRKLSGLPGHELHFGRAVGITGSNDFQNVPPTLARDRSGMLSAESMANFESGGAWPLRRAARGSVPRARSPPVSLSMGAVEGVSFDNTGSLLSNAMESSAVRHDIGSACMRGRILPW